MGYWRIYDRARNIGTKTRPHYVTIWAGTLDGRRWVVNGKPDPLNESGPIWSVQGGPGRSDARSLRDAVTRYRADRAEMEEFLKCQ